ncbi:3-isopropylmalate dehydratase small subunit [Burkholderia sp. SFA1]|uniref:3-isopropylmalate dehydratase small subunit n=1 Tax=Caballeronia sp. CLC5 TaxID=2906764 RepID=UPI001F45F89F|nr:3-isopropylmalate dehydratase small subunit [Caballeronia sp. CLC5]MCE4573920.1 3-isopropylmalate dehydratase small subunit [Caballeronia sp. CLC5]BBQ00766.1 3-isopropylmalate dehydratase small subunit [Burkholderia sp. SFA1]
MQPLTRLDAPGVPLHAADIDTDQILPARFMHARRIDYGRYAFHDLRADAAFVLNRDEYAGAQVLAVGPNFGCGSSREQAVHTLADYGIRALVGTSFGDIFFTNCLKNGVLPIRTDAAFLERLLAMLEATPGAHVRIDLPDQCVIAPNGERAPFDIDPFQKEALVEGLDEIDMTLRYAAAIDAYERTHGIGTSQETT